MIWSISRRYVPQRVKKVNSTVLAWSTLYIYTLQESNGHALLKLYTYVYVPSMYIYTYYINAFSVIGNRETETSRASYILLVGKVAEQ